MSDDVDLLRRAATLVRERAAATTPGPRRLARYENRGRGGRLAVAEPDGPGLHDHGRRVLIADFYHEGDREWYAATVAPEIGTPLADLLAAAAADEEAHGAAGRSAFADHALAVARGFIAAGDLEDLG